tara:strand:+ start:156320 stop:157981 length:1662 start_codon:yes stop_codon:yes gene_type:complete
MPSRGFTVADVTFAITAFQRPGLLANLVHSIRQNYPAAKIMVVDNGRRKATLPSSVRVFHLPFDSGISAARNYIASKVETSAMLLLEEDFLFFPTTRIEPLLNVLNADAEVGVVGGAMMGGDGRITSFSMDIDVFRRTMYLRESRHRQLVTPCGTPYRICDVALNFALFRREMLLEHPWDDRLKVGEHTPYFYEVKKARRWRVATCRESVLYHVPDQREKDYLPYRQRAGRYFQAYLKANNIDKCVRVVKQRDEHPCPVNPNVVILGVGHSGTSVLAKMLHRCGWESGEADETFGETISIRRLNQQAMRSGRLPDAATTALQSLPEPWAIKDPRFVYTLRYWLPLLARMKRPPALIMIQRNPQDVIKSYQRRGAPGDIESMVSQRIHLAQGEFRRWPWTKLTVDYEKLSRAVELFDPLRSVRSATDPDRQRREREHPRREMPIVSPLSDDGSGLFRSDGSALRSEDGSTLNSYQLADLLGHSFDIAMEGSAARLEEDLQDRTGTFHHGLSGPHLSSEAPLESFTLDVAGSETDLSDRESVTDDTIERSDNGSV